MTSKFIMLSQSVGNAGKSVSLIINVDTIDTVEPSNRGTDTRVLRKIRLSFSLEKA